MLKYWLLTWGLKLAASRTTLLCVQCCDRKAATVVLLMHLEESTCLHTDSAVHVQLRPVVDDCMHLEVSSCCQLCNILRYLRALCQPACKISQPSGPGEPPEHSTIRPMFNSQTGSKLGAGNYQLRTLGALLC